MQYSIGTYIHADNKGLMKYLLVAFSVYLGMSPAFGKTFEMPETIVQSFIADHYAWNSKANARTRQTNSASAMKASEREYEELIKKYCRPGFKSQPISYGDEPFHDPNSEIIRSTKNTGAKAIVRTTHTRKASYGTFVSNFEYHLSKIGDRWYLDSVLYVDADGKYESL